MDPEELSDKVTTFPITLLPIYFLQEFGCLAN